MNALEQLSLNDDWDYHVALGTLSEEIRKLRGLRELHALKLANRCQRKDLEEIKEQVKQTKNELLNLMLKVKNFTGQAISRRCEVTSLAQFQSFAAVTNELNSQFESKKKPEKKIFSGFLLKDWRRPTLAEPIGLLPSAQQRLTAVFGMGTGRTTAVLPPKMTR